MTAIQGTNMALPVWSGPLGHKTKVEKKICSNGWEGKNKGHFEGMHSSNSKRCDNFLQE